MIYSGVRIRTATAFMGSSTRRTFLQASALSALAATRSWGANDRINIGRISADLCHLATISYRLDSRLLAFNPKTERFTDDAANRLAHPNYRAPYVIPHIAS